MSAAAAETRFLSVRSFLRVRPFVGKELTTAPEGSKVPRPLLDVDPKEPNKIVILDPATKFKPKRNALYAFDTNVLWSYVDTIDAPGAQPMPPPAQQSDVYNAVVRPVLPSIGDGFSSTFLFIGGAESGKSHSLFGSNSDDWSADDAGIFRRFAADFFDTLAAVRRENSTQLVEVEVTEVNGETFGDLQIKKGSKAAANFEEMKVMQDATEGTYLSNSTRVSVQDATELEGAVRSAVRGQKKKKSSIVVTIRVEETYHFIDPTSDDPDHPNNQGVAKSRRFTVVFALLRSLSPSFKRCVELAYERDALDKPQTKVPVRESNVTKLLGDAFNGMCNVTVLTCVSPYFDAIKEGTGFLEMASKMAKIKTNPRHNHDSSMIELRKLADEVKNLNAAVLQENRNISVVQDELNKRQVALEKAEDENARAAGELDRAAEEKKKYSMMEAVAKVMVKNATDKKHREIEGLRKQIKDTNDETTATNAERHKIVAAQQKLLESIEKLEHDIASNRRLNEPIAAEHSEWRGFEQEVLDMEGIVNGAPDDRKKIIEERQQELHAARDTVKALEGEAAVETAKLQEAKAKRDAVKPAYDARVAKQTKYSNAKRQVEQQEREIAELEKAIAALEADNAKIEQDILAIPKGCCAVS